MPDKNLFDLNSGKIINFVKKNKWINKNRILIINKIER
ncbi:hypothetical protein ABIB39_000418 [Mucilaginibacter sp. UYP27]